MRTDTEEAHLRALMDKYINCEDPGCSSLEGEECEDCHELDSEIVGILKKRKRLAIGNEEVESDGIVSGPVAVEMEVEG